MKQDIRARIARALEEAGLAGFRDTTTAIRPQWRASFTYRGELQGETGYVHLYVPSDTEQLQVNCSAPAPALDPATPQWLLEELVEVNACYAPGSAGWAGILGELGAAPEEVARWEATTKPYVGMEHRMMLTRVTMPLAGLSGRSVGLAIRLGLHLARMARERLAAAWQAAQPHGEA